MTSSIQAILEQGNRSKVKSLFAFSSAHDDATVVAKFQLFARYFQGKYFESADAPFHKEIDLYNVQTYRGQWDAFVDIAFRGAAKTARTKLFLAYCIACDVDHLHRYIKVLCEDADNSKQIITDIYNVFCDPNVAEFYSEVFAKTERKREETMGSFTTATGIKIVADTVGTGQRGALQEDARPSLLWFEDFENRKTLRSNRTTRAIRDNMEEARTGLAKGGSCIYTCNYLTETGNVHQLVIRSSLRKKVLIIPIIDRGVITWDRYTMADIEEMKRTDLDFAGERLCKPSSTVDVLFDRDMLDSMPLMEPVQNTGGFKIFRKFNPSHRYGSGHDVAGGVGLDSSSSVFIDFEMSPCQVVATYADNLIKPDIFGHEIKREADLYGGSIAAIESNNHGHATIVIAKQQGVRLFRRPAKEISIGNAEPSEYGWHTNAATKSTMLFALKKAIDDGLLKLNDPALIAEAKSYSRNDLIESESDPRLTTRHFDLLIACAIAWQTMNFTESKTVDNENDREMKRLMREAESQHSILS